MPDGVETLTRKLPVFFGRDRTATMSVAFALRGGAGKATEWSLVFGLRLGPLAQASPCPKTDTSVKARTEMRIPD